MFRMFCCVSKWSIKYRGCESKTFCSACVYRLLQSCVPKEVNCKPGSHLCRDSGEYLRAAGEARGHIFNFFLQDNESWKLSLQENFNFHLSHGSRSCGFKKNTKQFETSDEIVGGWQY